jgi:hypothetical protein
MRGAAYFDVMMCETSDCLNTASTFFKSPFQNDPHCPIIGSSPAMLSPRRPAACPADTFEECFDFGFNCVVDTNGIAVPLAGDHLGGSSIVSAGQMDCPHATTGAIHGRTSFPEGAGDAASGAARGAGDNGDVALQRSSRSPSGHCDPMEIPPVSFRISRQARHHRSLARQRHR